MAKEFGRTKDFYKNNIWRTGKRVYDKINCPLSERENGENRYWPISCVARNLKNGLFEFKIRKELLDAFEETGISMDFYNTRVRSTDEILPWDFIDSGVTKAYLWREKQKADRAETTKDCRKGCNGCGLQRFKGVCKFCG